MLKAHVKDGIITHMTTDDDENLMILTKIVKYEPVLEDALQDIDTITQIDFFIH